MSRRDALALTARDRACRRGAAARRPRRVPATRRPASERKAVRRGGADRRQPGVRRRKPRQDLTRAMSSALTFARQHQAQPDRQRGRHRAVARDVAARSPLHVPLHPRLRRSARCKPSRAGMTCLALQASQHRPSQNVAFGYCTGAALLLKPRQSSPQIEQVRTSSPVTSLNAGASVARAVALRVRRRAIPRAVSG